MLLQPWANITIAAIAGLIIGFLVKTFLFRSADSDSKYKKELERVRDEYQNYQSQVSNHLHKTADLISNVQNSYQEIQEHIFAGAQHLHRDDLKKTLTGHDTYAHMKHETAGLAGVVKDAVANTKKSDSAPPKDYV